MAAYLPWGIFIVSTILLLIVVFRTPSAFQWLGRMCLHVALAIFLLYIINLFSGYTHFELPVNAVTVGTVSVLGVPGLGMLAALKLWVIG